MVTAFFPSMIAPTVTDRPIVSVDLRCAFSEPLAAKVESCFQDEVLDCFAVRRELINYKKVCLHLWQTGSAVEKDLRQLSSFFYSDVLEGGLSTARHGEECAPEPRRQRYCEIANALHECKGAMAAIWDARYFGKVICNLPRHPSSGVPWKFEDLPGSLEVWKSLEQARQFLRNRTALDAYLSSRYSRYAAEGAEGDGGEGSVAEAPEKPAKQKMAWRSDRHLVQSPLATEGLRQLMAAVEGAGLPEPARRYVELVLIARGAAKAMAIRSALRRYCGALREVVAGAEVALAEATALRNSGAESAAGGAALSPGLRLFAEKYARLLSGVLPVVSEMLRWLGPIAELRHGSERRFVSGSRGAAAFVPRGFPDVMRPFRAAVALHRGAMLAEVAASGWPRSAKPRPGGEEVHLRACRRCGEGYTKLWLHRELCFACEDAVRAEGRCPFGGKCSPASFCPHHRRCVVCEQWPCEECALLRGDGEDVWELVGRLRPTVVFLDFDRTLATTRAGGSPLEGNHSVDPDLAAVCAKCSRVQIITRNSRREDIEAFLAAKGVSVQRVRCIKREALRSKADAITEEMAALDTASVGVFVDDDIRELTDPLLTPLVEAGRLKRLLFVRAGGKE